MKMKCILAVLVLAFSSSQLKSQFIDATEKLGFSGGGKAAFADYNNDGFVDIHAGSLFMNDKGNNMSMKSSKYRNLPERVPCAAPRA